MISIELLMEINDQLWISFKKNSIEIEHLLKKSKKFESVITRKLYLDI